VYKVCCKDCDASSRSRNTHTAKDEN